MIGAALQTTVKAAAAKSIKTGAIPKADRYREWFEKLREQVAAASNRPKGAFDLILELEDTTTDIRYFGDSGSTASGSYENLEAQLVTCLHIPENGGVARKFNALNEELETTAGRPVLLAGRRYVKLLDEHMKLGDLDEDMLEIELFHSTTMKNNDPQGYVTQ